MKVILSIILLVIISNSDAQNNYKTWVKFKDSTFSVRNYMIYNLKDSSIVFMDKNYVGNQPNILLEKNIADIQKISFRNKYNMLTYTILGAGVGAIIGLVIGSKQDENYRPCSSPGICIDLGKDIYKISYSLLGGASGAIVGFSTSFIKTSVNLNGNKTIYLEEKEFLESYKWKVE